MAGALSIAEGIGHTVLKHLNQIVPRREAPEKALDDLRTTILANAVALKTFSPEADPEPGPREPGAPRARSWRATALTVALVLVVAGCLAYAVTSQWSNLPEIEWRFRPGWLGLALLALVAFQWLHIELWRGMLESLGGTLSPWKGRSIWSTTLLARYVPTSALMAVGRIALSRREGVAKRISTASVVYEVAFTFTAAVAVSTYLVLTLPAFEEHSLRWLVLAVPVAGLLALHPRVFHVLADAALRRLGREGLPLSLPFSRVVGYFVLFVLSFFVAGVAVLAMTEALHPVSAEDTPVLIASYSLGFAAGVIGFVLPGALGAREAGVAVAVAAVVPTPVALAVALVVRFAQVAVELAYAAAMPVVARRRP